MTPEQKKGEHGTRETVTKGGVRVNKENEPIEAPKGNEVKNDDTKASDYSSMSRAELKKELKSKGVAHDAKATKQELIDLLK